MVPGTNNWGSTVKQLSQNRESGRRGLPTAEAFLWYHAAVLLVHCVHRSSEYPSSARGVRLCGSQDTNNPPLSPDPRRLRPTANCQKCQPQESMGFKGAPYSTVTKGAGSKILSTLHPKQHP